MSFYTLYAGWKLYLIISGANLWELGAKHDFQNAVESGLLTLILAEKIVRCQQRHDTSDTIRQLQSDHVQYFQAISYGILSVLFQKFLQPQG
jgi:hypothetical protein